MEREPLVAEPIRLLDDQRAEDPLAAHAVAAVIGIDATGDQISQDPAGELRMSVEHVARRCELANVLVTEWDWNERELLA